MTVATESRVSASLLYVAIDLGSQPTVVRFSRQVSHVNVLWRYCLRLGVIASLEPPEREALADLNIVAAPERDPSIGGLPDQNDGPWDSDNPAGRLRAVEGATPLRVSRTSLASPWVSVLTTVAEKSAPVAYGAAALFAMQRLLNMIIVWQRHRIDIQQAMSTMNQSAAQLLADHATEELRRATMQSSVVRIKPDLPTETAVADLAPVLEAKMVAEDDPLARS